MQYSRRDKRTGDRYRRVNTGQVAFPSVRPVKLNELECGKTAVQYAVPRFISNFNDTTDEVALVSFSENAQVDYTINYNFITSITNKVGAMSFAGGTFGTGAGTTSVSTTKAMRPHCQWLNYKTTVFL